MAEPLVSILINNYNYGRFLREAIDSALNQTYRNTEVIVVDDGSTDDSRAIIASYGDKIFPVLKENGGQASAFNAGFAASRGEIICFLDSDDVWLPTKVQSVVRAADTSPDAVLIYHGYRHVDSDKVPFGKSLPLSFLNGDVSERVRLSGGCWPFPPTSGLAFRRTVLNSIMPIPEKLFQTCADACLAYSIPLLGPVVGIKEALCLYRIHGSNLYTSLENGVGPASTKSLRRMERYQMSVEGANEVLARIGSDRKLALTEHVSYIRAKYTAGVAGRPSWLGVSWKILNMRSEPRLFVRSKTLLKFWLELSSTRPVL